MRRRYKLLFLLFIPISFILTCTAKYNSSFAEFYAVKIYPVFAQNIGWITSFVPVSLGEIIIIVFSVLFVYMLLKVIFVTIANKSAKYIKPFLLNLTVIFSCLYFIYVLFCGLNYYRYEFTYYSKLNIKPASEEQLVNLCEHLIDDANNYRAEMKTDNNNITILNDDNWYETAERAKISLSQISDEYKILKGNYQAPKPVVFSKAMSYAGITGIFFPFTFESNVNVDIPAFQIPFTMCHELAHLRGFMREDEANFISYLACINSGFDDFAYSGTILALNHSMNALYLEDKDEFSNLLRSYSEGVLRDLKFSSDYWAKYETKTAEISKKVNDVYLKSNNQKDGVKSYGRMVDLLIAYYNKQED